MLLAGECRHQSNNGQSASGMVSTLRVVGQIGANDIDNLTSWNVLRGAAPTHGAKILQKCIASLLSLCGYQRKRGANLGPIENPIDVKRASASGLRSDWVAESFELVPGDDLGGRRGPKGDEASRNYRFQVKSSNSIPAIMARIPAAESSAKPP